MGREVKGCNENNYASYLRLFLAVFLGLALFFALVLLPWSAWWIAKSGDNAIERVVEAQAAGHFVIFGCLSFMIGQKRVGNIQPDRRPGMRNIVSRSRDGRRRRKGLGLRSERPGSGNHGSEPQPA